MLAASTNITVLSADTPPYHTMPIHAVVLCAPARHHCAPRLQPPVRCARTPLTSYAALPSLQAKVTADGKPGFFAIASAPDVNNQGVLELLIKVQPGATAEAICGLAAGADLMVRGLPDNHVPNWPATHQTSVHHNAMQ